MASLSLMIIEIVPTTSAVHTARLTTDGVIHSLSHWVFVDVPVFYNEKNPEIQARGFYCA